ncbi:class I SAM-dependent methyltransferase [Candidatus Woesearchaeota archaeon]|nr:class I SAM-dependent methyltransferase [Candidatus Woesearchaeota archaeon]
MSEERFSGKLGKEYNLVKLAYPHHDEFQEKLVEELDQHHGRWKNTSFHPHKQIVLEIGTGTGITTEQILRLTYFVHVDSIDNEPVMIAQAEEKLEKTKSSGKIENFYEITCQDVRDYFYEASVKPNFKQYDAVASAWTLHNLEQRERRDIYKGILHVLKPGGLFVNADKFGYNNEGYHYRTMIRQTKMILENLCKVGRTDLAVELVTHNLEDNHSNRVLKDEDTVAELTEIGFVDVKMTYRHLMEGVMVAKKPQRG